MGPSASDVRCADGRTPLHWVAMTGANAAVRVLISELGADIMAVDAKGFTALHHAAHMGRRRTQGISTADRPSTSRPSAATLECWG